ncbi:hypothetical protein BURPSS13_C0043 [Burkholderia pseudomallei S13]|nr:hypothetical protein BURPSS13_C0043 [Burkholderia pseudomallei S13]
MSEGRNGKTCGGCRHAACSCTSALLAARACQRRTCGRSSSSQYASSSVMTSSSSNFAPTPAKPRCGSTAQRPGVGA